MSDFMETTLNTMYYNVFPGDTLKVSDSCKDAPGSCPVNSECQAVGCLDKLCVCVNQTLPSPDKTECFLGKSEKLSLHVLFVL